VGGQTLETRQIKVLTEHSRVAVELHSHVRQLTEGLKAEPSAAQDDTKVADLLDTVYADQSVAAVLDKSSVAAAKAALETAQHDYQTARHHLSGLTGSQLANGDADATKWLADYVEAEMDLAEKISDLANVLRRELRTAEGVNEIQELLGQLDDLAMSVELNGVKLERLGAELAEVKDATVVNEIVPEFDSLVQGMNPNEDERRTANEAIESFVTTAKPLLDEIAKLDHAGPDAQTATFVASLKAALDSAKNALAGLARLPGVNKDGLRQFDANLDRARQTLVTCQTNMRQHLYESGKRELYQLLLTAQSAVHNAADQLHLKAEAVDFTNSLVDYVLEIDKDPTQTDQIFTQVEDFLRHEDREAANANRASLVKLSGLDSFS